MKKDDLKKAIKAHKKWLDSRGEKGVMANFAGEDLDSANLNGADLRGANLAEANLSDADLRGANLDDANLDGANLDGANLRGANLSKANLFCANLRCANLKGANLSDANLDEADLSCANLDGTDLRGANLDYSCWPLWCGSLNVKIDSHIAAQLMYHCMRAMKSVKDDADIAKVLSNKDCMRLANRFHRSGECGKIKNKQELKRGERK